MNRARHPILRFWWGLILALALVSVTDSSDAATRTKSKKSKKGDTYVWTPSAESQVDTATDLSKYAGDSPSGVMPAAAPDTAAGDTFTALDTALAASDTNVPDTLIYSARIGGQFYHKREYSHAPAASAPFVSISADTMDFADSFLVCPICFEEPITEEDFALEEAIGNQVAGIVEFRYRRLDDDRVAARLANIGKPMTQMLDRRHLEFYFTPLRSTYEKNAISAGNGYIYFTTGLLDIMEDDDEVAAVLAHEISHAEFRHVLQDFKLSQKITFITAIASAVINKGGNIGGIFQIMQDYAAQLVMNGFSRQFELEADAGAKWILESMGRDTAAMRRVLLKLDDLSRDAPKRSALLMSHPEETERIKAFDQTRVFNKTVRTDTLTLRLKFQRPRLVGWFKERSVPALYASLVNETDSDLMVNDIKATYHATDLPNVKVEVSPTSMVVPKKSYAQLKILVIAKNELIRDPKEVTLTCTYRNLWDPAPAKKGKREKLSATFRVDLSE